MVDLGVIIHHAMLRRELSPIRCETLDVDPVRALWRFETSAQRTLRRTTVAGRRREPSERLYEVQTRDDDVSHAQSARAPHPSSRPSSTA
jgi:hypothetical protein